MAWAEIHQSLKTHRKLLDLASKLHIPPPHAGGHLLWLWLWALDNADPESGAMPGVTSLAIAVAAQWPIRTAEKFLDALIKAGFIEIKAGFVGQNAAKIYQLHDWADYAGRLGQMRRSNRERQQRFRERAKAAVVPSTQSPQRPVGQASPDLETVASNAVRNAKAARDITVTSPLRNAEPARDITRYLTGPYQDTDQDNDRNKTSGEGTNTKDNKNGAAVAAPAVVVSSAQIIPEAAVKPPRAKAAVKGGAVSEEARELAAMIYEHLKAIDGLPAGKPFMAWAAYAQRRLLTQRPSADWRACILWAQAHEFWGSRLTSMAAVGGQLWTAFAAERARGQGPKDDETSAAAEAWAEVMGEIRRVGTSRPPVFSDALAYDCVQRMGWGALCMSEEERAPVYRAEFMQLYRALSRRHQQRAAEPMVPRVAEMVGKLAEGFSVKRLTEREMADGRKLVGTAPGGSGPGDDGPGQAG